MPSVKEILQKEQSANQEGKVILFEEGLFWKAYEMSAFLLAKRYGLKPTKRYIKAVEQEVITVGFPKASLRKFLGNATISEETATAYIQDMRDPRTFSDWKVATPMKEKRKSTPPIEKILPPKDERTFDPYAELPRNYYCDELPVFRHTAAVLEYLFPQLRRLSKDYRYTIGQDIVHALIAAEKSIFRAWRTRNMYERLDYIDHTEDQLLETKLLIRLLHETRQIDEKTFATVSEKIVHAERHLNQWREHASRSD